MNGGRVIFLALLVIAVYGARIKIAEGVDSVTATFVTGTPTRTHTPSSSPSPGWYTDSVTPTISHSHTTTATRTANYTETPSRTTTSTRTHTPSSSPSPGWYTDSVTPTISHSHTTTATRTANYTETPSRTTTSTRTHTPSSSPSPGWYTDSVTPTISHSHTTTATRTANYTETPSRTTTSTRTHTPSSSRTPVWPTSAPPNSRSPTRTRSPNPSQTKGSGFPACSARPIEGLRRGYNLTVYGSNQNAPVYADACQPNWSSTVWYSLTPEGNANVTVTTCNSYTNFDTILTLQSGLCSELSCVSSNDDACSSRGSTITWTAAPDTTYYISVSGYNNQQGSFELVLSTTGSVDPTCYSAIDLPGPYFTPLVVSGSIVGLPASQMHTCGLSNSDRTVWYLISPAPGGHMLVTTCSAYTDFDTSLSIFEGSCDSLRCVTSNDNNCTFSNGRASTVSFSPTSQFYYVVVSGTGAAMGYYQLYLQQEKILGYGCASPFNIILETGNVQAEASTVSSGNLTAPICHTEMGQAYWYYVTVTHTAEITISTCSPYTNFDTYLSVYSGSCSSLSCVGYNDDSCDGTKSQLTINRNPGENFFVVVSGKGGAVGTFELSFTLVAN